QDTTSSRNWRSGTSNLGDTSFLRNGVHARVDVAPSPLTAPPIAPICNEGTVPHKALLPEQTARMRLIRAPNAQGRGGLAKPEGALPDAMGGHRFCAANRPISIPLHCAWATL
ncbi:hypothetical protein, partial [Acidithiobacillus sp.]|uniref:hypothetical protein n=1 Tax=Acidithiobacillus sp. TaxID=1872118 RepID=UPI003CFC382E